MIQELLGESSASLIASSLNTFSPSSTSTPTSPAPKKPNQNLKCPRCDSSNTKFCYYNNYNLTQPRHFCKTCRRYWTKGGALRNVPIGGGCRRSKNVTVMTRGSAAKPNTGVSLRTTLSCEIGKLGFEGYNNDQLLHSSPILWAPSHSSQILALLRSSQNPSPNPSSFGMKGESSHILGLGQFSPFCLGEQSGFVLGQENHSNSGNGQHLYQRLRSTRNYYQDQHSSGPTTVLESTPIAVSGDLGFSNPAVTWSHLPTNNAAYP